jgi:hypothetical protein
MAITDGQKADLRAIVAPMAAATSRLSGDDATAEQFIAAVQRGDSAAVARVLEASGARGVTHRTTTLPGKTGVRQVLSYSPNARWHIHIEIDGGC